MKHFMREYSNIGLTNVLEINAPRGQIRKLINIREVERKSIKKSCDTCSGGLTLEPVGFVRRTNNGKQRSRLLNVVAD